jgi:indole-3-acetate monooxygenase
MDNSSQLSSLLKQKSIDIIRDAAARAEKDSRLTKAQLNLINEQQWPKMLAPMAHGGLQMSLPDALALQEAICWADGSTGWLVANCAIGGWQGGFLESDTLKKTLSDSKAFIAIDGETPGTAEKTKTGYKINGRWQYAPGANDATAFIVTCSESAKDKSGQAMSFLLLKSEVNTISAWSPMGLSASIGQGIEAKDVSVPAERAFKTGAAKSATPLYQYPLMQLTEASLALCVSGMTAHFLDLCNALFAEKTNAAGMPLHADNLVQDVLSKYSQKYTDARSKLYYGIELSWQSCVNNQPLKPSTLYRVSSAAYDLARRAKECADALYIFCGMDATDKASEINRVWRDLHTASHHSAIVFGGTSE